MSTPPAVLRAVLSRYGLAAAAVRPLLHGHINGTWRVDADAGRFVLQRMHPVFAPAVQADFAQVAAHLARAGLLAAQLVPTRDGELCVALPQPGAAAQIWRLQTFLDGVPPQQPSPAGVASAGALLGRTHAALRSFSAPLAGARVGVHDIARHARQLAQVLAARADHPAHAAVAPVARAVLQAAAAQPAAQDEALWVVHGDPKLSNFLFAADATGALALPPQAVAMVDFDTFNRLPLAIELGDAWRSWCNPCAEDDPDSHLDLTLLEAACGGYGAGLGLPLGAATLADLERCAEHLALELAARFARDALEETYFGWDRQRFGASWEHQLQRARAQLALARSHRAQGPAVARLLRRLFCAGRLEVAPGGC